MMDSSMTRRHFLTASSQVAIGGSLLGSLMAACGPAKNTHDVTYWVSRLDQSKRPYFLAHDIDPFNRTNSEHINVQVNFKSGQTIDRIIQTAFAAGTGPDLVYTPGPSYADQYINANLLLNLDTYARQYNWQEKIQGWALDAGRLRGKLYALPYGYEAMVFFYNKTLFAQKGWKIPTNRDELEALAEEIQGQHIMPFIAGNLDWRPATEWFVSVFLNHYAGPDAVYQALTGQISWTDPIFVEAIDLMKSYFQKGWFGKGIQYYFSNRTASLDTMFGDGTAAIDIEGSWLFTTINNFFGQSANNKNDWDWAPIPPLRPGVPETTFALGIGGTLSINAQSTVADQAAQYLDWYYSDPKRVATEVADIYSEPPPVFLNASDFPSYIDKRVQQFYLTLNDSITNGKFGYTTWAFWPPKTEVLIYQGMDKVLAGMLTPAEYCQQLDQTFKQELSQGGVPSIPRRGNS